jgi:hypothetical protein
MSFKEKYEGVLEYLHLLHGFVLPIVERRLGVQKVDEIKVIWQNETKPIPERSNAEEKFEIAYGNWVRNWESAYNFVQAHLGKKGLEVFKDKAQRANVDKLKQKAGRPALLMLRLIRAVSPATAFRILATTMSYQLQVFTPFKVSELSGERLILDAHPCKVANSTNSGACCTIGCQQIYPNALEPFGVCLTLNPKGRNCTIILTPISRA